MLLKYLHHVLTILPILSLPLLLLKIPVPSNCIPLIHILRGSSIYFIFIFLNLSSVPMALEQNKHHNAKA